MTMVGALKAIGAHGASRRAAQCRRAAPGSGHGGSACSGRPGRAWRRRGQWLIRAPAISARTWRRSGRPRRSSRRALNRGRASKRHRPRSVWELLPQADPGLSEWAAFFAASAAKRAAAEAGLPRAASAREAEDLIRDAETFLRVAERALGVDGQSLLPLGPPAEVRPPGHRVGFHSVGFNSAGRAGGFVSTAELA